MAFTTTRDHNNNFASASHDFKITNTSTKVTAIPQDILALRTTSAMRGTIQIAFTALYLLLLASSVLCAQAPTIHASSAPLIVTHRSYGYRQAVGISTHRTSSQRTSPPSVLAYSYPPGRLYASDHDSESQKESHDIVKEAKEPSYENRKAVVINAHHTSSQHNFPSSVLAYSYQPGRLYDPKTDKLGLPSPENREGYGQEETKHVPSSSSVPESDVMPGRDEELPSSWILMQWKVSYVYIIHSKLFTENVFEWALWLLGLALVIAVGMEILSVWNGRMERFMEGTEGNSEDDDGNWGLGIDETIKRFMMPKKTATKNQLRSWYAKMSIMTSQYKHKHSATEESTDLEEDVDENRMEESSW